MPATAIDIRPISFVSDVLEDGRALVLDHWMEVCTRRDLFPLRPDMLRYRALEGSGTLLSIGAFVGRELVGYSCSFLMPHLHYADTLVCHNDVLFVAEPHRSTSIGRRLVRETERMAKAEGAVVMSWHAKKDSRLERIMGRPGSDYWVQDIVFSKEL